MLAQALFRKALSQSREERAAFLAHACAGRPDLLAAVEALLAAHDRASPPPDETPPARGETVESAQVAAPSPPTGARTSDADSPPTSEQTPGPDAAPRRPGVGPGLVIAGRYTLQEKLGAGGMGEV